VVSRPKFDRLAKTVLEATSQAKQLAQEFLAGEDTF
jgi:hypothetical protein